jgi:hypothetical protein
MRVLYSAGANASVVLPARTLGYRVTDVHVIGAGGGVGTVKVTTSTPADVTNAMAEPAGAGGITRATTVTNGLFAGGASIIVNATAATAGGNCYIRFEGL